jgi:hypothetical protein
MDDDDDDDDDDEVAHPLNDNCDDDSSHEKRVSRMQEEAKEPVIPEPPPAPEPEITDAQSLLFTSVESPLPVEDKERSFSNVLKAHFQSKMAEPNYYDGAKGGARRGNGSY